MDTKIDLYYLYEKIINMNEEIESKMKICVYKILVKRQKR